MDLDDRLYTEGEVAKIASVKRATLRRWHRKGLAVASRRTIGGRRRGHRRYTVDDLRRVVIVAALRDSQRVKYRDLATVADSLEDRATRITAASFAQ